MDADRLCCAVCALAITDEEASMTVHPCLHSRFHVHCVEQPAPPSCPVCGAKVEFASWELGSITAVRVKERPRRRQVFVTFKGFGAEQGQWLDEEDVASTAPDLVREFRRKLMQE